MARPKKQRPPAVFVTMVEVRIRTVCPKGLDVAKPVVASDLAPVELSRGAASTLAKATVAMGVAMSKRVQQTCEAHGVLHCSSCG